MTIPRAATGAAPLEPPVSKVLHRPILVATDGTAASDPALLAARLLAAPLGVPARVVSVAPPQTAVALTPEMIPIPVIPAAELVASRADRVRDEMQRVLGDARAWPMDVRSGVVPIEVADAAREMNAQLVVTGLRHRGRLDRALRGETPLGILNEARLPTLVVPPGVPRLPASALVAVDLGDPSVDAASFARPLVAEVAMVYLVHVEPEYDLVPPRTPDADRAYAAAVERAFDRVTAALALPAHVHVERKVLSGSVAHELLDFAEYARVDLIVTGHRRRTLIERIFSGGTAARLFHGLTSAWLLVVPEDPRHRERLALHSTEDETNRWLLDRAVWARFLDDFTRRNAGRTATLEIHDDFGAQTVAGGYPLLGMDYEREGARVDFMLGDAAGRHLRHSVVHASAIEVHRAPDGRDSALRVTDRSGAALLTLAT